jgi:adenylate cyclase
MLALPLGTGHQVQRPQIGSGPHPTAVALAAAIDLAGQAAPASTRPSVAIPVGTAVHTGEAFVGATGLGTTVGDFTALGDVVNITARLASAAPAGEVIVSVAAAEAAEMKSGAPWRSVDAQSRSVIVLPAPDTKVLPDEHHV